MKKLLLLSLVLASAGHGFSAVGAAPNARPLTLATAVQIALTNQPQIAAADDQAAAAREVLKQKQSAYFPTLNLYGDVVGADSESSRVLAGGLNNPSIYERAAGGLAVNQLITDFGRTANLVKSSRQSAQAATEQARATREQIWLRVHLDYLAALEAQAVLHVARQTLDTRQLLVDQVTVLASNQLKSDMDVSFARVAYQEGRLLWQQAANAADDAQITLSTTLGYREPQSFVLAEPTLAISTLTNDLSMLVESALAGRPELLSLRHVQQASLSFARSQRDARRPSIVATGLAGAAPWHDSHLADNYAVGGFQINLPVFAGGLYTARQHEAEWRAQAVAEQLHAAEDEVVRDVHLAWANLNNAQENLHTTEQLLRSAGEAYSLAEARYRIGSSSIVELSQAQLSLTSAQIAQANARYTLLMREAQLRYSAGLPEGLADFMAHF